MTLPDGPRLAVIGGTGLDQLPGFECLDRLQIDTPYGETSGAVQSGLFDGQPVIFLARHGEKHNIPPHSINYRANIWALRELGVKQVLGVAAVGGIREDMSPGRIAFPDQILDYTWGREHTFFDGSQPSVTHIEFSEPYDAAFRQACIDLAAKHKLMAIPEGVYAATQGPRLESIAEVRRLQRDGADMVGMTGMPEAALACEAGLAYVCCAVMVNWAAGLGMGGIHDQIEQSISAGMAQVKTLIHALVTAEAI